MTTLSFFITPLSTARVEIKAPRTREVVGTLVIAGPDHSATKAWSREINERRQKRGYKQDIHKETIEAMTRRTLGWEGVKDKETGEDVPFDPSALPAMYEQDWLMVQVLEAIGEEDFFFTE